MSSVIPSPNMSLPVPVVGVEPGPQWATDVNNSLGIIDGHNHVPGSGVPVPTGGININADLSFNINNATMLRTARFSTQNAALAASAPDLACLFSAGTNGELYYNNGIGQQVQITLGGNVNATSSGISNGTASASFVSSVLVVTASTGVAAPIDAATLIVRYPGSYPSPSGNYIAIEAPSSLSSAYALTLPALPAQTNVMTLGNTGVISSTTWDAVGQNMTSVGADAIGVLMDATGANSIAGNITSITASPANVIAAARTRTQNSSSLGIGGVPNTGSSGLFSTSSTSFVQVTNQSITLVTSGRPVMIMVRGDGSSAASLSVGSSATIAFFEGSTAVDQFLFSTAGVFGLPSVYTVAFPGSGSHTYTLKVKAASGSVSVTNCIMVAYEL